MLDQAAQLKDQLLEKIETAADMSTLEDVRVTALGKKGQLTELMKGLGKLAQAGDVAARVRAQLKALSARVCFECVAVVE